MRLNKILVISIFVASVYVAIISFSDTRIFLSKFASANPEYLVGAMLLFSTRYFVRFFRWLGMLKFLGIKVPILKNITIYYTGYAFTLTPAKVGEGIDQDI